MLRHLAGKAPLFKNAIDRRGWGPGNFTSLEGYRRYATKINVPANPKIWNQLWSTRTLPKIDLFIWTLLHERILTGENLIKKGFAGPFRCPLCAGAAENISHLFLQCSYATLVWDEVLNRWGCNFHLPDRIQNCFLSWDSLY